MNKEQIIKIARDAGFVVWVPNESFSDGNWWIGGQEPGESFESFSAAIIAATKEEDAKICEEFVKPNSMQNIAESIHTETASKQIAAAIRESKP